MQKQYVILSGLFIMISIVLGAMGAHALKKILPVEALVTFETGVRYQMYHALFLLFLGSLNDFPQKTKKSIWFLIVLGVIFFSGSIYLLATNSLTSFDFKVIGFVTPIGGLLLILGWGVSLLNIMNKKSQN